MTHPEEKCNKEQAEFLASCPSEHRRFHELIFKVGNATFRYHQLAKDFNPTKEDWSEWIQGLNEPMKSSMEKMGFQKCIGILSFTRYVNEKNDIGLDEFLAQNINHYDLLEYKSFLNK